jgi:nitroreductase
MTPEALVGQFEWRYAVKKFDSSRTLAPSVWGALAQALVLTPSSFGLQPWKFFVVTDPAVKAQLPAFSWGQTQPQECSHMVVFAIKKDLNEGDIDRHIRRVSEVRGTPVEALAGFRKMMVGSLVPPKGFDINDWAARQVYIALGQFMAAAAVLGVDTCPMEGINPAKYDELLGISAQGYQTIVACAAGYRAPEDKYAQAPKVRFKAEDVLQII